MNKLIAIVAGLTTCLVAVIAISCRSSSLQNPPTVNTTNKDRAWHINFLKTRISSLQPANGGVEITGRVFQSLEAETHTVPVGYKINFPDDHGSKVYTITDIQSEGIVIKYESTFDHRSFGKNLIERDGGVFKLAWLKKEATTRPDTAALFEAIDDWVLLIETDRLSEASKRWCQNEEAAQQMTQWWQALKRCHQRFDYRNWARQANELDKPTKFTVGGHSAGYMHTIWELTPCGWRITRVFICR